MTGLYVLDEIFKGIRTPEGKPFFSGAKGQAKGEFGGLYTGNIGASQKSTIGPRGGNIKGTSPTTGKPIYYQKWKPSARTKIAAPTEGGTPEGYAVYKHHPEHVIGKTGGGQDIHAFSGINNTKHYKWDDHRDASHAHFTLAQHLMNVLRERADSGGDTTKIRGLIDAHSKFAQHHRDEAVKDLLHGKQQARSEEDLSLRESPRAG
jgi:hypothetical protein